MNYTAINFSHYESWGVVAVANVRPFFSKPTKSALQSAILFLFMAVTQVEAALVSPCESKTISSAS